MVSMRSLEANYATTSGFVVTQKSALLGQNVPVWTGESLNLGSIPFAKEMTATLRLSAAALGKLISAVTSKSNDVEHKVDDILGLTLSTFNLALTTEADFREILVRS